MRLKEIAVAALLFLTPWLIFLTVSMPWVAERMPDFLFISSVLCMLAAPLLGAWFLRGAQRYQATPLLAPVAYLISAYIINSPVILLSGFVALCMAALAGDQCNP